MDIDQNDLLSELQRNVEAVLHKLVSEAAANGQLAAGEPQPTVADERELIARVIGGVNNAVANTVSVFARAFNEAKPGVHRLPPEVLCYSFRWLPFRDLVTATHICRHWRVVALGDVSLWWHIVVSDPGKLATLLERTQDSPISVELQPKSLEIDPRDEPSAHPTEFFLLAGRPVPRLGALPNEATKKLVDGLYETLIPHMGRVRALRINRFWHSDALDLLLTTPAPTLRRLMLSYVFAPGMDAWYLPADLFGGVSPNVRDMSLDNAHLCKLIRPGVIPELASLRRILHNLRRLEYKGSEFGLTHVTPLLQAVREVILVLPPESWASPFSVDRPLFKILPRPRDVAQIAMVHGKVRTIHDLRWVREVNTTLTHEEATRLYLRNVMQSSSSRLVKLQLDEEYWKMVVGDMRVAEFPLLMELNIVLAPRHQDDPSLPLLMSLPLTAVPKCPALQMLSLWGYYSASRRRRERHALGTVKLDDLTEFLRRMEARPAVVLRRGLTVAQDAEGLARLKVVLTSLTVQLQGVQDDIL